MGTSHERVNTTSFYDVLNGHNYYQPLAFSRVTEYGVELTTQPQHSMRNMRLTMLKPTTSSLWVDPWVVVDETSSVFVGVSLTNLRVPNLWPRTAKTGSKNGEHDWVRTTSYGLTLRNRSPRGSLDTRVCKY